MNEPPRLSPGFIISIEQFYKIVSIMKKSYTVGLWPFAGYLLCTFNVYATCSEEALDLAIVEAEKSCPSVLLEVEQVEDEEFNEETNDQYLYIDATMKGAARPYYVDCQNLKIIEN